MELKEILQKHNVYSEELYNDLKNYIHPVKIDSLSPTELRAGRILFSSQVLESLGWERYNEFHGYEGDRYAYYKHWNDTYRDIVVYGSILTFELAVLLKDNMEEIDFKNNHVRENAGRKCLI